MSDTQGIDAACAHKQLKKQMVGEFVYYICECGQKFRVEPWDGKVSVLPPPDPRKDLAALERLVNECGAVLAFEHELREISVLGNTNVNVFKLRVEEARAALAEMRGAKRESDVKDNPIKWNPYNKVVQDHRDGTIDHEATNRERAKRGLPVPWKPEMGDKEVRERPVE